MDEERLRVLTSYVDKRMRRLQGEILSLFELVLPNERQVEKARQFVFSFVQDANREISERIQNLESLNVEEFRIRQG